MHRLTLDPGLLSVCRLPNDAAWPLLPAGGFVSVTRTADELSVICAEDWPIAGAQRSNGWRCLTLQGPFDLAASGVLAPLAGALAQAGVSLLPVATFDTDHLLVRQAQLDIAVAALEAAGCNVRPAARSSPAV